MQDVQTAPDQLVQPQSNPTPLPLRNDTILGVCEALGEDLGFNATLLRIVFCAMIFFSPQIAAGSYLALGVIVAASRLLFPKPTTGAAAKRTLCGRKDAANEEQPELPLAA